MPWTKKYEPETLDDFKGNQKVKRYVRPIIESQEPGPALIFYGRNGLGKTTMVRIIKQQALDYPKRNYEEIDCGTDDGRIVQKVTQAIKSTATNSLARPMQGDQFRMLVLDEADQLSEKQQERLNKTITKAEKTHQVILIANELSEISESLKSRCPAMQFKLVKIGDIRERLKYILEKEDMSVSDQAMAEIISKVNKNGRGDIRNAIKMLELEAKSQNLSDD